MHENGAARITAMIKMWAQAFGAFAAACGPNNLEFRKRAIITTVA